MTSNNLYNLLWFDMIDFGAYFSYQVLLGKVFQINSSIWFGRTEANKEAQDCKVCICERNCILVECVEFEWRNTHDTNLLSVFSVVVHKTCQYPRHWNSRG